MSIHVSFWIQGPDDKRRTRDFFYGAANCDQYWVSPQRAIYGPPDDQQREHYAVFNDYNIVDITDRRFPDWEWPALPTNTHVWFTLNQIAKADQWLDESLAASLDWLTAHPGDLLLAALGIPVVARRAGDLLVNARAEDRLAKFALNDERAAGAMKRVVEALQAQPEPYSLIELPAI